MNYLSWTDFIFQNANHNDGIMTPPEEALESLVPFFLKCEDTVRKSSSSNQDKGSL